MYYKEWSRPLNTLSDDPEEEKKLMYVFVYVCVVVYVSLYVSLYVCNLLNAIDHPDFLFATTTINLITKY